MATVTDLTLTLDDALTDVAEIRKVRLEPGDVLIFFFQGRISRDHAEYMREQVKRILDPLGFVIPVMILEEGMRASVLSTAREEDRSSE